MRDRTLLVELANADGELDRLKSRKRSRKRSRSVDLISPVLEDLTAWRELSPCGEGRRLGVPARMHG